MGGKLRSVSQLSTFVRGHCRWCCSQKYSQKYSISSSLLGVRPAGRTSGAITSGEEAIRRRYSQSEVCPQHNHIPDNISLHAWMECSSLCSGRPKILGMSARGETLIWYVIMYQSFIRKPEVHSACNILIPCQVDLGKQKTSGCVKAPKMATALPRRSHHHSR